MIPGPTCVECGGHPLVTWDGKCSACEKEEVVADETNLDDRG